MKSRPESWKTVAHKSPEVHSSQSRLRGETGSWLRKYFLEAFISSNNPPWFDARAVALGLIIGFGVPMGAQMICLGVLRLIFRFNIVIAFVFTWVNNPVSILPMYYAYYLLGSALLGKPAIMTVADFQELMRPVLHAEYFWGSVYAFIVLGWDLVIRWSVAAALIAVPMGILGYVIGYRIQRERCKRKAKELGITYMNLLRQLEKEVR